MVTIRNAGATDSDAVGELLRAAFPTHDEAKLVDALGLSGRLRVSLVAVDGGEVVGHVGFSPVTAAGGPGGLGLAPLAVRPDRRRQGIAGRLVEEGLTACRALGATFVVVLGDPHYYARFGFRPASTAGLIDEYGGGDAFQALELVEGALPVGAGLVKYAAEFNMVSGDPPG